MFSSLSTLTYFAKSRHYEVLLTIAEHSEHPEHPEHSEHSEHPEHSEHSEHGEHPVRMFVCSLVPPHPCSLRRKDIFHRVSVCLYQRVSQSIYQIYLYEVWIRYTMGAPMVQQLLLNIYTEMYISLYTNIV